jgi:gamma-glutamyltranspeptidase/glutathione hydrolase
MQPLLLAIALAAPVFAQRSESASGMVSSSQPLTTAAGVAMLRSGGNAFDAAVAVATTLNVVEPQNSGLGGYGLIVIYDAVRKQVRVLNASGRIPKGADRSAFDAKANRRGAKTIAPPVNARAWEELSRGYGKKPWKSLFAFAIEKAERGFVLLNPIPEAAFAEFPEHARAIYGRNGKPLRTGDTLVERDPQWSGAF